VANRALMIAIAEVTVLIALLDPVITMILMVTACNA
jgi:hypothetical protein